MQDVQLTQSTWVPMSTNDDQSTVMGTTPTTIGSSSQGATVETLIRSGQTDRQSD